MVSYQVYGTSFTSTFCFPSPLETRPAGGSLHIEVKSELRAVAGLRLIAHSPDAALPDASLLATYASADGTDLLALFNGDQIESDAARIVYRHPPSRPPAPELVDVQLLGNGFAWWLLRQGVLPFHAGAVVVDGEALLLIAESGVGKSTLLASLIKAGVPLLADDFVALRPAAGGGFLAAPAYPQLRLWPETIERFVGPVRGFPGVLPGNRKRRVPVGHGWGRFFELSVPVARICLLQREPAATQVRSDRLTGHEAFMTLLTAILLGPNLGAEAQLPLWSAVRRAAEQIPLRRVTYPSGWEWLPALQRAVLKS